MSPPAFLEPPALAAPARPEAWRASLRRRVRVTTPGPNWREEATAGTHQLKREADLG
jgi:hypothetical protein